MNRSQTTPLGLSEREGGKKRAPAGRPNSMDRWLVGLLSNRFDSARVRFALWDEGDEAGNRELPVVLRFRDSVGVDNQRIPWLQGDGALFPIFILENAQHSSGAAQRLKVFALTGAEQVGRVVSSIGVDELTAV